MSTTRPGYRDKCTCGHLGIHHLNDAPFPCVARRGDCPCNAFVLPPENALIPAPTKEN